ncbi:MAG: hypothetical protein PHY62_03080 [Gallionella sp.]|nr:hypothetical protein [Gallionella sp.]
MMYLTKSLSAWGSPDFEPSLKQEIAATVDALPLQQALAFGNRVTDEPITVVIHRCTPLPETLLVKVGVFYQGIISGCNCSDDPTPTVGHTEYCELSIRIDRKTALTEIVLVNDD